MEPRDIQSREGLFSFLQMQMQSSYVDLEEKQRLPFESNIVKTYVFELSLPDGIDPVADTVETTTFIEKVFGLKEFKNIQSGVESRDEEGFYKVWGKRGDDELILYLDAGTDKRFWLGFSVSKARFLDWWLKTVSKYKGEFDFIWLWPGILEKIQTRGIPRGFGLSYDYRKFQNGGDGESETTSYLKMQIWGGSDTRYLYNLLRDDKTFSNRIVLSKVRLKEFFESHNEVDFALQDLKYTGKFTVRGTDFGTHSATLGYVRSVYASHIKSIEQKYALRWSEAEHRGARLVGHAIHFISPSGFEVPVKPFCEHALNGTEPFKLLGVMRSVEEKSAFAEAVDLHTGSKISFEIYPDVITAYIPQGACGNTIARFYTNLQHYLNANFTVKADNGDFLFQSTDA